MFKSVFPKRYKDTNLTKTDKETLRQLRENNQMLPSPSERDLSV